MPLEIEDQNYTLWVKIAFAVSQAAIAVVGTALNLGIIYYENSVSDNRRTLINKMMAVIALYSLGGPLLLTPFMAGRILFGAKVTRSHSAPARMVRGVE